MADPGGAGGLAPPIFRPNWGPKGVKKFFGDPPLCKGLDERPPPPLTLYQGLDPALL